MYYIYILYDNKVLVILDILYSEDGKLLVEIKKFFWIIMIKKYEDVINESGVVSIILSGICI